MDLGSVNQVYGVVTQDIAQGTPKGVTAFEASYSVDNETFTVIDAMLYGPRGTPFEMPCAGTASTKQEPCSTPDVQPLHIKTSGSVIGPYGGPTSHIMMWSLTMEKTNLNIKSGCVGCLLEFSNGKGGTFKSTGVKEWARDDGDHNTMFFYLPEGVTGHDVNAIISVGDTLTATSLTDDGTGPTPLHQHVRADFPAPVAARYIRLRPLAFYGYITMRAGLLVQKDTGTNHAGFLDDMFLGRHHFRRCIVTDGYTRLVHVGSSSERSKSTSCPGCYECREIPDIPGWGWGSVQKKMLGPHHECV